MTRARTHARTFNDEIAEKTHCEWCKVCRLDPTIGAWFCAKCTVDMVAKLYPCEKCKGEYKTSSVEDGICKDCRTPKEEAELLKQWTGAPAEQPRPKGEGEAPTPEEILASKRARRVFL